MITFIIIPVAITAYLIGKYVERFRWNKLIRLGVIPRPKNSNLNHEDYWANRS